MIMRLNKAELKDFERLTDFYRYVIDNTDTMKQFCRWIYGKHPSDEMIREYIDLDAMYFCEENGNILAAVAVTPFQDEEYRMVEWKEDLKDDEVAVVHLLCTDPKKQRQGLAKDVMKAIFEMAKESKKKAVRLDALDINAPAHKLYQSLGFENRGVKNWYACNLGWVDFTLYEFDLK